MYSREPPHERQGINQLFPGHVSTLKVTDPELTEIFDDFACENE